MATSSVRYSVPSSNQGISVTTHLVAPSYSQDTIYNFLKSQKAKDFALQLNPVTMTTILLTALGIPTVVGGIYAAAYSLYYQNLVDEIGIKANQYPGVLIKVVSSTYGKFYSVEGWSDVTTAVVYLTNSDSATENVTGVYNC